MTSIYFVIAACILSFIAGNIIIILFVYNRKFTLKDKIFLLADEICENIKKDPNYYHTSKERIETIFKFCDKINYL
jgi:hypothetical protein